MNTYFSDPDWLMDKEDFKLEGGTYFINATFDISKKVGKGKHRTDEYAGTISIGKIVITPN